MATTCRGGVGVSLTLPTSLSEVSDCNLGVELRLVEACAASCCKPSRQRAGALPESCSITITALLHPVAPAVLDGESR